MPSGSSFDMQGHRCADENLLAVLGTRYICDLMVEKKKKKLGVYLTSSEKVEMARYGRFAVNAVPYPGCEFFTMYKLNHRCGRQLFFDWSQSFVNSALLLEGPCGHITSDEAAKRKYLRAKEKRGNFKQRRETGGNQVSCLRLLSEPEWSQYQSWDIVELTQKYLELMLAYVKDPSLQGGLLIHCISGWDRTPLFISLLRLSLWADGQVVRRGFFFF